MTSTLTSKPTLNPVLRSFWTTQARNKSALWWPVIVKVMGCCWHRHIPVK
ncbi:hypothetical protein MX658_16250 [Klebsiella pneumoniae]|nr:hypothetical protein MX658_16250 [Klebsiella pneumoniae]